MKSAICFGLSIFLFVSCACVASEGDEREPTSPSTALDLRRVHSQVTDDQSTPRGSLQRSPRGSLNLHNDFERSLITGPNGEAVRLRDAGSDDDGTFSMDQVVQGED